MDFLQLKDRLIIVTGAGSGLGYETALLLHKMGARVIAISKERSTPNLYRQSLAELSNQGIHTYNLDLRSQSQIQNTVIEIVREYGKIEGFVHFAGTPRIKPIRYEEIDEILTLYNIHVFSALEFVKALCDKRRSKMLSIVLVSSISTLRSFSGLSGYASAKGAISAFCNSVAGEVARLGFRINTITPGDIKTSMTDTTVQQQSIKYRAERIQGEAIDVANLCAFLLSPASKFIHASEIVIDGGVSKVGI